MLFRKLKINSGRKVRLMQITHDLAIGGLQQVVVNLCRNIDRDIFDLSVLCLRHKGEFAPEIEKLGINVFTVNRKPNSKNYLSFLDVARILRQEKIDVIHTHNIEPFVEGTLGAILSGVKSIIHTDHARPFPDELRYMIHEWIVSQFAYRVVGVSNHTAANLIKYEKISKRKIRVIENGIDPTLFAKKINPSQKRVELGLHHFDYLIGLGVRLTEQKGISYLLKAMPEILNRFPKLALIIAGDGPLLEPLKKECIQLNIDKNVIFIGSRLDIHEILQILDVYVLPSVWEGLPMVLLEAMASSCPIIATDVGGVATAVKNGKTGLLVESMNPSSLASAVIKMLTEPTMRKNFAEAGLKLFHENFTVEIMTKKYESLYLREAE